jgi:peptide/nickel transport system permease protein
MLGFIVRRILWMIPSVAAISLLAFTIIQLPPGDFVTSYAAELAASGDAVDPAVLEHLRARFGLDQAFHIQYLKWIGGILQGDFGDSLEWRTPVSELIWSRLAMTALVSACTLIFIWIVAFPIGIYSAVRQYSIGDYIATFFGFLGMATPSFLLALFIMYVAVVYFGLSVGGLFSPEYADAPWSWARVWDMLPRLWIPVVVLGTAGTAALIRIMRANLLDELHKPYVVTGRAKGLKESDLILRYPVRVALNPFISTVGWVLPTLISGEVIVSSVLSLQTCGPLLLQALKNQDMYLAGAFIMLMCLLVLLGTLLSDVLLAWLDPRIRYR